MSAAPPASHRALRVTWSVVHTLVVVGLVALAVSWWMAGGQGGRLASSWWEKLTELQRTIAHALPYPWDHR